MFSEEFGWALQVSTLASILNVTLEESADAGLRCTVEQAWGGVEDNLDVAGRYVCIL
jgi:hypothetical protein